MTHLCCRLALDVALCLVADNAMCTAELWSYFWKACRRYHNLGMPANKDEQKQQVIYLQNEEAKC